MKAPTALVLLLLLLPTLGCLQTNEEREAAAAALKASYDKGYADALARVADDVAEAKLRPGRFQFHQAGARTWRFDTASGAACLVIAPIADT